MRNTKIWMLLTVVALTFLFVGAVSAADNTAVDTVKIKEKQKYSRTSECKTNTGCRYG